MTAEVIAHMTRFCEEVLDKEVVSHFSGTVARDVRRGETRLTITQWKGKEKNK